MASFQDEAIRYVELVTIYKGETVFIAGATYPEELTVSVYEGDTAVQRTFTPIGYDRFKITTGLDKQTNVVEFTTMIEDPSILSGVDLTGYRIRMYRTLEDADHTDPNNAPLIFDGVIIGWSFDGKILRLRVSVFTKWSKRFPKTSYSALCRFVFKGERCGYTGTDGPCKKTKDTCLSGNFCGFPSIAKLQRRVSAKGF